MRKEPPEIECRTPRQAERAACEWLRWMGFDDARLTRNGADGGIDVRGSRVVAQVKAESVPSGPERIRALFGVAAHENRQAAFFSWAGYTRQATIEARHMGVSLFTLDRLGRAVPLNEWARSLMERATLAAFCNPSDGITEVDYRSFPDDDDSDRCALVLALEQLRDSTSAPVSVAITGDDLLVGLVRTISREDHPLIVATDEVAAAQVSELLGLSAERWDGADVWWPNWSELSANWFDAPRPATVAVTRARGTRTEIARALVGEWRDFFRLQRPCRGGFVSQEPNSTVMQRAMPGGAAGNAIQLSSERALTTENVDVWSWNGLTITCRSYGQFLLDVDRWGTAAAVDRDGATRWSIDTGGTAYVSPPVLIHLGNWNPIRAWSLMTGELAWELTLPACTGGNFASPGLGNSEDPLALLVTPTGGDPTLHAIDPRTGNERWRLSDPRRELQGFGQRAQPFPTQRVRVSTADGWFVDFDARTGAELPAPRHPRLHQRLSR
jgi:hypothetical protein